MRHPAQGVTRIGTCQGSRVLFGTDIVPGRTVLIRFLGASTRLGQVQDDIEPGELLFEVEMTTGQFGAALLGADTPCTVRYNGKATPPLESLVEARKSLALERVVSARERLTVSIQEALSMFEASFTRGIPRRSDREEFRRRVREALEGLSLGIDSLLTELSRLEPTCTGT